VKDATRFALAIAAILTATAFDAQQAGSSQAGHAADTPTVRSAQPDEPPPNSAKSLDRSIADETREP
jgi:hypothetical protein